MLQKKVKIIVLTASIFMISTPLFTALGEGEKQQSLEKKIPPISYNDPNWKPQIGENNTGNMYWKLMTAVGMVLVLGSAGLYLSKKLGSKIITSSGKEMQIAETLCLGTRKAIHLLKIGDERLIIATTATSVTTIAKLDNQKDSSINENNQ